MAGEYRPRHPERTVLYRVMFHHFDRFLAEYEGRFEQEYGFFRPVGFHLVPRIDDSQLEEIFAREVLADLVRKELLNPLRHPAQAVLDSFRSPIYASS